MPLLMLALATVLSLALSKPMIPTVIEYFPQLEGDLTRFEWEHATNNWKLLQSALDDPTILMLEADVILGHHNDDTQLTPVMGHPPATQSDLSLLQFIEAAIENQTKGKKGIKLDFKSDDAYNASWAIIGSLKDKLTFPVWLNADILPGPVNATNTPLNAQKFLSLATQNLPEASLSLGWTTNFHLGGKYSSAQLGSMLEAVQNATVQQPITLAARAAFAANSADGLKQLVLDIDKFQGSNSTTLTIWMSSATDIVNIAPLRSLILDLGKDRSALDVPVRIRNALNLSGDSSPVTVAKRALGTVLTSVTTAFQHIIT